MWRSKKFIVGAVLVTVLLFGSLGGVALADDGDGGPPAKLGDFINNVINNYEKGTGDEIEYPEALKQAFTDARVDMCKDRAEMRAAAMGNGPQNLTDEQKDALQEWLDARPEIENGPQNLTDKQKEALQEWWDSRPEDMPLGPGSRGPGGFHGMGGMRGFFGPCALAE